MTEKRTETPLGATNDAPDRVRVSAMSGQPEMQDWQKIRYGDTDAARAALAFLRSGGWAVDNPDWTRESDSIEERMFAFMAGYETAKPARPACATPSTCATVGTGHAGPPTSRAIRTGGGRASMARRAQTCGTCRYHDSSHVDMGGRLSCLSLGRMVTPEWHCADWTAKEGR